MLMYHIGEKLIKKKIVSGGAVRNAAAKNVGSKSAVAGFFDNLIKNSFMSFFILYFYKYNFKITF